MQRTLKLNFDQNSKLLNDEDISTRNSAKNNFLLELKKYLNYVPNLLKLNQIF